MTRGLDADRPHRHVVAATRRGTGPAVTHVLTALRGAATSHP